MTYLTLQRHKIKNINCEIKRERVTFYFTFYIYKVCLMHLRGGSNKKYDFFCLCKMYIDLYICIMYQNIRASGICFFKQVNHFLDI